MLSADGQNSAGSAAIELSGGLCDVVEASLASSCQGVGEVWSGRGILAMAVGVLGLHTAASIMLPSHGAVTCLGIGACYAVAGAAAYRLSRGVASMMRVRWLLLSSGLCFGALTWALTLYQEGVLRTPSSVAGVQDVALVLRGIPFLISVCLTNREIGWLVAILDFAQVALIAYLTSFALLHAGPNHLPVSSDAALFWLTTANVAIASLASLRCMGGGSSEERRFFSVVGGFLWVNAAVTSFLNLYVMERGQIAPGAPLHLLCDLSVLGLAIMLPRFSGRAASFDNRADSVTFFDTIFTLFLPTFSLLVAASIVPEHLRLGLGGVAVGFVLYGVRSTVVLKKALSAQHELLVANRSIQDQALSDGLTGIPNRRSFDLTLEREWKRAQRSRQPLALLMLDVDHFKDLNDRHGHLAGDGCLREIAGLLRAGLGREADFAARYGGEEFAVLLIDTGLDGARTVAESLRRTVELHHCALADGTALSFTVSIGIASEVPMVQESSVTLVAAADKALYRAKRSGRNQVEVHAWRTDAVPAGSGL